MATAKKAAKKPTKPKPATPEERLAHLEERHDALVAQLKLHGIHLDLGDEDGEEEEGDEAEQDGQKE